MGVGLRFRDPQTPPGDRIEIFITPDTAVKMHKLLSIVGGKIVTEDTHPEYIHMIVEKLPSTGQASPRS